MPDPKHFLYNIRKNTNKYLYIEVPGNYRQLQSIQNAHTMFFSSNTLIDLVVSESFNLDNLSKIKNINTYLSIDKEKYKKYIETYIKTKGSPEKLIWDIVIEKLEKDLQFKN